MIACHDNGKTGAAAVAGLGVDGLGVATIADPGSGAAEAVGKLVGAPRVSLVGSGKRATVSAGGVGVGSGTRVAGSDGGICDGWEEAEGVVGSGIVASAGGEAAATDGIASASRGGCGAGVDRGSPPVGREAS